MLDADVIRFIKEEIKRSMNVVLTAISQGDLGTSTGITDLFPGMPLIEDLPVCHPYGFASAAPDGTFTVVARQGEHIGNRIVIGHKDTKKPSDLQPGESCLYNANDGREIRMQDGKTTIGSKAAAEPLVLGNVLVSFMTDVLNLLIEGDIVLSTSPGNATAPNPLAVTKWNQMISKYLTTTTTNIISQENFSERGSE